MEENTNKTDKEMFIEGFRVAPCTYILVAVNILIFIVLEMLGGTTNSELMLKYGAMNAATVLEENAMYRFFTCMFMHFGIEHLLNNMLLLFFVGQIFEKAVGSVRFTAIYLAAGLTGSLFSFMNQLTNSSFVISAGASGAIFGIIGGMIVVIAVNKGRFEGITIRKMILMAALSFYFGLVTAGTDNSGHLGGLLGGLVYTFMLYGISTILRGLKNRE